MSESEVAKKVVYAFGHLVASYDTSVHSAASGELARDCFEELGFDEETMADLVEPIAEHVAGNYEYTGAADDWERRVKAGEA